MIELPRYFRKKLNTDEEVKDFVRPFGLVYFWWWLLVFVLIFGDLFYMFYLLDFGVLGAIIFWAVLILGIFALIKTLIVWRLTAVVITTERVVDFDQHSLFVRQISETLFTNIQDITMEQNGFWATVLKFGTIKIQTAGATNVLELQHIRNPRQVQELLVDLNSTSKHQPETISTGLINDPKWQGLIQLLEKKKQEIGKDNLKEVIKEWLEQDKKD